MRRVTVPLTDKTESDEEVMSKLKQVNSTDIADAIRPEPTGHWVNLLFDHVPYES